MPMPKPKTDESKKDFLQRCMGDPVMVEDYDDEKQRYAICNSLWDKDENKSIKKLMEQRFLPAKELRVVIADDQPVKIVGYSAVYNSLSDDLGGFKEIIRPGAFTRVLMNNPDVRALVDHDPSRIIGRTPNTLKLSEDSIGLHADIEPPETTTGRDILISLQRGDVTGMSFAFYVANDNWIKSEGLDVREIIEIGGLFDVSIVTYPAYPETVAGITGLRSTQEVYAEYRDKLNQNIESEKLVEEELEKRNILEKEYRDREIKILSL